MSNEPKLQELVALHAMVTRMRVLSSPRTVTCAEKIMKATVDTYFAPVLVLYTTPMPPPPSFSRMR
jgi:hypothetical protein